jgi:hypothetical protein
VGQQQQQQVEHEDAIGDVQEDGERVSAGFEKRMAASYAPCMALQQLMAATKIH